MRTNPFLRLTFVSNVLKSEIKPTDPFRIGHFYRLLIKSCRQLRGLFLVLSSSGPCCEIAITTLVYRRRKSAWRQAEGREASLLRISRSRDCLLEKIKMYKFQYSISWYTRGGLLGQAKATSAHTLVYLLKRSFSGWLCEMSHFSVGYFCPPTDLRIVWQMMMNCCFESGGDSLWGMWGWRRGGWGLGSRDRNGGWIKMMTSLFTWLASICFFQFEHECSSPASHPLLYRECILIVNNVPRFRSLNIYHHNCKYEQRLAHEDGWDGNLNNRSIFINIRGWL